MVEYEWFLCKFCFPCSKQKAEEIFPVVCWVVLSLVSVHTRRNIVRKIISCFLWFFIYIIILLGRYVDLQPLCPVVSYNFRFSALCPQTSEIQKDLVLSYSTFDGFLSLHHGTFFISNNTNASSIKYRLSRLRNRSKDFR